MLLNIEKIKGLWEKLIHQQATPNQIASGFTVGFFVSFLPIPPFQTLATLLLAWIFRANKIACLCGVHFHLVVFPIVPVVFLAEYSVGKKWMAFHHLQHLDAEQLNLVHFFKNGWPILECMFVGAIIFAIPSCILAFWIVRQAALRWQASKQG